MKWFLLLQHGMWYVLLNDRHGGIGTVDSCWYERTDAEERRDALNRNMDGQDSAAINGKAVTINGKPI